MKHRFYVVFALIMDVFHQLISVFILAILFQVANFLQGQLPFDLVPVSGFWIA